MADGAGGHGGARCGSTEPPKDRLCRERGDEVGEQANPAVANIANIVLLLVFFGLMWLMWIRPQQQQQKRRREMLAKLKVGDKVVTVGGVFGTLTRVDEETVRLRIADRVEVKLTREAVARVLGKDE